MATSHWTVTVCVPVLILQDKHPQALVMQVCVEHRLDSLEVLRDVTHVTAAKVLVTPVQVGSCWLQPANWLHKECLHTTSISVLG